MRRKPDSDLAFRNSPGLILELQRKRHSADYDPSIRVKSSDAQLAVQAARNALSRFNAAGALERESFLSLLLFNPR